MQLVTETRSEETKEDKYVELYYNWVFSLASPRISTKQLCFQENRKKTNSKLEGLRTQDSGGARPELSELPENPDMLAGTQGR